MEVVTTRKRRVRASTVVVVAGLVLLALAVVVAGLRTERHTQGFNYVRADAPLIKIQPGQSACQSESVPAGTGGVQVQAFGNGTPFSVSVGGARGEAAAGWKQGSVTVDIPETRT